MIAKNKQSPNTLYLLNAKNNTHRQQQQQRKSARLTFNKKKSARSISQYQKWNPSQNKQPSTNRDIGSINVNINHNHNTNNNAQGQFYLHSSRNEQIKKIVLSRNQFSLQPMGVDKKLISIIEIFKSQTSYNQPKSKRVNTVGCETLNDNKPLKKSQQPKSGETSLLSLKEMNEKQLIRNSQSRGKFHHKRKQSMLNHTDQELNTNYQHNSKGNLSLENILGKIQTKFKAYEKQSQNWRLKHLMNETDYLIDDILKIFKSMFNEVTNEFTSYVVGNINFYQTAITEIAKDYEMQITMLKDEIEKNSHSNRIMESMLKQINEKHYRGIVCSKILEDIALQGTNIQNFVKTSTAYDKIVKLTVQMKKKQLQKQLKEHSSYNLDSSSILNPNDKNTSNLNMCNSDDEDFYEQEKNDQIGQDSNWNDHFQNRQSIKGVLKYIHNHNQNKQMEKDTLKSNLNSTGYLMLGKDKADMKIDNWKNFQDKSIGQYKKIMSQR